MDPHNLLSPGSLVESSPICRTSTPPRPRDRAEAIVLADAFFVVSSLPPHVPCWAAPALSPPAPSTPHHQKMSVFIAAAEQRRWSRRVLWHSVWKKVRRRSWSLISSRSCSSSCSCSSSWSLISSSHQESVITDTPTLEAHHPAVTFFCWWRWKLLKLVFLLEWQFWFASITLFIHSWYVKQSFPIQIQNQT